MPKPPVYFLAFFLAFFRAQMPTNNDGSATKNTPEKYAEGRRARFQKGHLAENTPGNTPGLAKQIRQRIRRKIRRKLRQKIRRKYAEKIRRAYFKTSVIQVWLYIPVGVGPTEVCAPSGFLPMLQTHGRQKTYAGFFSKNTPDLC